jgi:hypothetical protein
MVSFLGATERGADRSFVWTCAIPPDCADNVAIGIIALHYAGSITSVVIALIGVNFRPALVVQTTIAHFRLPGVTFLTFG